MRRQEYETVVQNGFLRVGDSRSDLESSYAASEGGRASALKGYVTESSRRILPRSSNEFTRSQSVKISSRPTSARSGSSNIHRMSSLRGTTPDEFNRIGSFKRYTGKISETVSEYSDPGTSNKMVLRPSYSLQGSARDLEVQRRPLSTRGSPTPASGSSGATVQGSKACVIMWCRTSRIIALIETNPLNLA
jgi:hypothetical protein